MDSHRIERISRLLGRRELSRRHLLAATAGSAVAASGILATARQSQAQTATPAASPVALTSSDQAAAIIDLANAALAKYALNAVIVRVTVDGQELVTAALGESMTGVSATTDMHFRNGAVAISYVSTLLLRLVDQGRVNLDDKLATWLPDLPDAEKVTLRMLTNMTAGYPDFVQNAQFLSDLYANPFRQWTPAETIASGLSTPRLFAPGTNWDYSHTNYVILGQALEKLTGTSMETLIQEQILGPLGLTNTTNSFTPTIPEPVLHAFSAERRPVLGIPAGTRFYEETTFWNPSWTLAKGAIQTTNIYDMAATAEAIGTGALLSPASYQAMVAPDLLGFGTPLKGCPNCRTLNEVYNYGLGVVLHGEWLLQNPLYAGYGAVEAYLPAKRIAIAVATTFSEDAFDDTGIYKNSAHARIFEEIATYLAPDHAPSTK